MENFGCHVENVILYPKINEKLSYFFRRELCQIWILGRSLLHVADGSERTRARDAG